MDAKTKKIFSGIFKTAQTDFDGDVKSLTDGICETMETDFETGIRLWEFCLEKFEKPYLADSAVNCALSAAVFDRIADKFGESKAIKTLLENNALKKAFLMQSDSLGDYHFVEICVNFLVAQKTEELDEMFRLMQKNTISRQTYGQTMKRITERFFDVLAQKHGVKNFRLSKKQIQILTEHIEKIKGPEKALLLQRIKELN